jgi:hypothetical protein
MSNIYKTILKAWRRPEPYRQQMQAQLDAERAKILAEAAQVDLVFKPEEERQHFWQLSSALDFIATCLETDDVSGLASELSWTEDDLFEHPEHLAYFKLKFDMLKDRHERKDLRKLYAEREFPRGAPFFTLGGPLGTLEHMQIHFIQADHGWLIGDVSLFG